MKYRVHLVESERGWGQEWWHEDFDTREKAQERIESINSQNTAKHAPDWYIVAKTEIEIVK